jgi:hypothetical protein
MSQYATIIDQVAQKSRDAFRDSILGPLESIEELYEVWHACRTPGWDGYGALAVEQETYHAAYTLVESLPLGFLRPTFGAEPDGQLTLEWRKSPSRVLSVSVDPDGFLHYAGVFGAGKKYGTLTFFSVAPPELLQLVRKL